MMLAFVYKEHFLNKLSSCHLDNFISFPLIYSCVCPMRIVIQCSRSFVLLCSLFNIQKRCAMALQILASITIFYILDYPSMSIT